MPLLCYNLTTTAVTLAAGTPVMVIPASATPGVRGAAVNVTTKIQGLAGADYTALQVQVAAGSVVYEWTSDPEYSTGTLIIGGPSGSETRVGHVRYSAPLAAAAANIVAALNPIASGVLTIIEQPDYPRKLSVGIVDANSSVSAGIVTLVGIGPSGEAVTETITLTGGTATKISTKAYAKLTSATVSAVAGAAAGDTVSMGNSTALGLPGCKIPASSTFAVFKADVDNANETVGTVDATAGTIIPTTAANGTRVFDFWYTYATGAA